MLKYTPLVAQTGIIYLLKNYVMLLNINYFSDGVQHLKPNSKLLQRLRSWMRGRYGQNDTLNRFLNNLALLLIVISFFIRTGWLLLIAVILIGISYWRLFSKKIYQQVAINRGFQRFWSPIVRPFSRLKYQVKQHWQYRVFRCSQCHQRIRIPRHHGRVRITCPQCGHQFEAKV